MHVHQLNSRHCGNEAVICSAFERTFVYALVQILKLTWVGVQKEGRKLVLGDRAYPDLGSDQSYLFFEKRQLFCTIQIVYVYVYCYLMNYLLLFPRTLKHSFLLPTVLKLPHGP